MIDYKSYFSAQLDQWQDANQRFEDLKSVSKKDLSLGCVRMTVQFNPARIVSTGAKIDKAALAKRPCFLCEANRPAQQMTMPMLDGYQLLVNPFPILPQHFTIPATSHTRQEIRANYLDMMKITEQLEGLMVFYNGPKCGASAPDHLHFQAGTRGVVPIERDWSTNYSKSLQRIDRFGTTTNIYSLNGYLCPAYVIVSDSAESSDSAFKQLYDSMPIAEGEYEPAMNILSWVDTETGTDKKQIISIIIPRGKHRPDCYFAEGDEQILVSPGALDMGGLIITPREQDYNKMTADIAASIITACAVFR